MASVIIKRDTLANINATPITDGQLLFSTDQENDNNKIYADVGSDRKVIGGRTEVVDNLTSTNTTKALSANMGKELNENIGDLTTLTTTKKSSVVEAVNELKGVSDEINSNLKDNNNSYVLLGNAITTKSSTYGTSQSNGVAQKFSDYKLLSVEFSESVFIRGQMTVPTSVFRNKNLIVPFVYANTLYFGNVTYVDDTHVTSYCNITDITVTLTIRGLK